MEKRVILAGTSLLLALLLASCGGAGQSDDTVTPPDENEAENQEVIETQDEQGEDEMLSLSGEQSVIMEGFDWGPAITKTILKLDQAVAPDSVTTESFVVTEKKEAFDYETMAEAHITSEAERTVTSAYVCDAAGEKVEAASEYIALEMEYAPNVGSPYCYDANIGKNTVCNPYELTVTLADDAALETEDGAVVAGLDVESLIDLHKAIMPQLEGVEQDNSFTGADGKTLMYSSYSPEDDGAKHPLVIWLHGAGEGGKDTTIPLLGNKVNALYGDEFQSVMGGAFILVPQTETFWLQYNEEGDWQGNPGTDSVYLPTLMELIEDYVANHENVDTNRIYVGGCSNGGYMTMDIVMNHPDYFAAAFPICEAYLDSGITDEQLEGIKDLPIWFIYAANDTTVDPAQFEAPTIERLQAIGADVHTSVFPNVVDTSGLYFDEDNAPYEYAGHWSWLYFFNNECEEDGVNMWNWLAEQSK